MKLMTETQVRKMESLRKELNDNPEPAGLEHKTAEIVSSRLNELKGWKVTTGVAGKGIIATYGPAKAKECILFRAELDALTTGNFGSALHLCGHDGHMAILLGLADVISAKSTGDKKVVLFFQPAEETGAGALAMIEDKAFKKVAPDLVIALHNLPGVKENTILIKDGSFSSSVKSLVIRITGTPAHAAEPEKGHNPIYLQSEIIQLCRNLEVTDPYHKDYCLITPTYLKAGLPHAHGVSAGNGILHLTFRTREEKDMERVTSTFLNALNRLSILHKVETAYNPVEAFPAVNNSKAVVDRIRKTAKTHQLCISEMILPFSWGEDFGHLTQRFPGAMFGLGAGIKVAPLHSDHYSFPDKIMGKGVELMYGIVSE